jgi:hypothetical protein
VTPIADLAIHKREHELVAATQGRAFWILDDTQLLAQLADGIGSESVHLFAPKHTYRTAVARGFGRISTKEGANPATGAVVYYWLKDKPKADVTLEFLDDGGKLIKKFSSAAPAKKAESRAGSAEEEQQQEGGSRRGGPVARVTTEQGLNRFEWDLRYPDAVTFPGIVLWAANVRGPLVVPGSYQVRLTADGKTQTQKFEVRRDPRVPTTPEQYTAQLQTALQMRDKVSQTNQAVIDIRQVRDQIEELTERLEADKSRVVLEKAKSLTAELTAIEESLYQTKNRASEDPLNFPVRLNNKLAALLSAVSQADAQPTASQQQVYEDLATGVNAQMTKLKDVMSTSVPALNKMVKEQDIPAITIKSGDEPR